MKILVIGQPEKTKDFLEILPENTNAEVLEDMPESFSGYEIIFDLDFDSHAHKLSFYAKLSGKIVVINSIKKSLAATANHFGEPLLCHLMGMNALPGFIRRNLAEMTLLNDKDYEQIEKLQEVLQWNIKVVNDRVGMVTPRILFMIINEACYTLQEGTASISDIDTAMKLGTNYPYGPFEWADKIGIKDIYETLLALYDDTKDERYKICPLLKRKYMMNETFYES